MQRATVDAPDEIWLHVFDCTEVGPTSVQLFMQRNYAAGIFGVFTVFAA
jgi:hypothetical protein